ncbi:MAG: chromosomal replication initiator protein DnaA [Bryobacteraceae bacterium]
MSIGTLNLWEEVKSYLKTRLNPESYQNWLAKTSFLRYEGDVLFVAVPNRATRDWMQEEYAELIQQAIQFLSLPVRDIVYEIPAAALMQPRDSVENGEPQGWLPGVSLNPRFTFETFVVGPCNQLAHAAAKAVASNTSRSYNPLFIYGGAGLGKTHLMHAIGHALVSKANGTRVLYTSSERFMNELIQCISQQRMPYFHQRYRRADVLLVDDIHIIAGKERTQEEFFHTFNELYDHQKQIVISSDSPPKDIPGLVERLRSRFEWGLMVDLQPPDLETKMAILDRKADIEGVRLPDDVLIFIATKTKSSVRELEGALIKVIAHASVNNLPITLDLAKHCLRHLFYPAEKRITIESVQKSVADHYGIPVAQLKQKSNSRRITEPRQLAMYIAKEVTGASLPEIGRAFGGKHHTTVLHSIQKIESWRQRDPEFNRIIQKLIDSFS